VNDFNLNDFHSFWSNKTKKEEKMELEKLDDLLETVQEWNDFIFLNDPLADCIRRYCQEYEVPDSYMYKMICVAFYKQKNDIKSTEKLQGAVGE
jgi:hypothetical protein